MQDSLYEEDWAAPRIPSHQVEFLEGSALLLTSVSQSTEA